MARVTPMGLIESMTGKICQDSDISFVRRNGKIYTSKMCHPYKGPATAKQTAAKSKFKTTAASVKSVLSKGKGDPDYDKLYEEWQMNKEKYPTFRGYVFALEYKKE